MRHPEDFTGYAKDLRKARRLAKQLYVHFRVMYDDLMKMPSIDAEADYGHLDDVQQCLGDCEAAASAALIE